MPNERQTGNAAEDQCLKVGFVINPVAGIGGEAALMGSDGRDLQAAARRRGSAARAPERASEFLAQLLKLTAATEVPEVVWLTWGGPMGADALAPHLAPHVAMEVCGYPAAQPSRADTQAAVMAVLERGAEFLVFVGGDGTARDVLEVLPEGFLTLGVPAGVKMHSGVFAVSPYAAAQIVLQVICGGLATPVHREVRDFVEEKALGIEVTTFGYMTVPEVAGYLQHTKVGGVESEPLAVDDIVQEVVDNIAGDEALLIGPGSTCMGVKERLAGRGTLRGFDIISPEGEVQLNLTAGEISALTGPVRVILSFTRQQGFLLGRGNQQLTPAFLRRLNWQADVVILATRTKLASLEGRPLLIDTGDAELDRHLSGFVEIVSGYEDRLLYRVARDYRV